MTLIDSVALGAAPLWGAATALMHMGLLRASLARLGTSPRPGLSLALGAAVRCVLASACLAATIAFGPLHLALAFLGFIAARQAVLSRAAGSACKGRSGT